MQQVAKMRLEQLIDRLSNTPGPVHASVRRELTPLLREAGRDNPAFYLDEYRQARLRYYILPPSPDLFGKNLIRWAIDDDEACATKVAVVECLSRIGDAEALTLFRDVLETNPGSTTEKVVYQAVLRTMPDLLSRVQTDPERRALVRPNCFPNPASDGLPRLADRYHTGEPI